jgi:hypothetical protein
MVEEELSSEWEKRSVSVILNYLDIQSAEFLEIYSVGIHKSSWFKYRAYAWYPITFYSNIFYSILFYFIPFCSDLFYCSNLLRSTLFSSIFSVLFYSTPFYYILIILYYIVMI